MRLLQLLQRFTVLSLFVTLAACSATDNGGSSTSTSGTGRVSLLITDAPTDEFDQVNVTIESVVFIADESDGDDSVDDEDDDSNDDTASKAESGDDEDDSQNVVLFEGSKVVNLLELRNFSELLATVTVPAGTYSKIRLKVSKVELVKLNDDGTVASSELAKLPANGKIDLNPRGEFTVSGDGHLVIELDIDAEKSILVVANGKGYNFRPVVFVNILGYDEIKLSMLDGKVMGLSDDSFQLCDEALTVADDSCLDVVTSGNTVVQDSALAAGTLANDDRVTVLGKVSDVDVHALHVVITGDNDGSDDNLARFGGQATSAVNADSFGLLTDDSNALVPAMTDINVTLASGARIFDAFGAILGTDVITDGADLDLFGLAQPTLASVTDVKAAFVIYAGAPATSSNKISGTLVSVDTDAMQLTVSVVTDSISADVCVDISAADLFVLSSDSGGTITSHEVDAAGLLSGMTMDIYTRGSGDACAVADVVLATAI